MAQNEVKHSKKRFRDCVQLESSHFHIIPLRFSPTNKKVSFGRITIFKFPKTLCSFCSLPHDHNWTEKSAFCATAIAHLRNFWADSVYPWYWLQSTNQTHLSSRPGPRHHLLGDDLPAQMECCLPRDPQRDDCDHSSPAPSMPRAPAYTGSPGSTRVSGNTVSQACLNNSPFFL